MTLTEFEFSQAVDRVAKGKPYVAYIIERLGINGWLPDYHFDNEGEADRTYQKLRTPAGEKTLRLIQVTVELLSGGNSNA